MAPIGPPWGGAWFPDENTFLGSGCNITNTSSMKAATRLQVYFVYILSRSGRAVAHDEERRAFERLGKKGCLWSKYGYLGARALAVSEFVVVTPDRGAARGVVGRMYYR